jgi:non-ribosomal peptide synthetase component E (peptide arylation enzyme)
MLASEARRLKEAISAFMPPMTAADFCDRNGREIGDREALVDRHHRLTWKEVSELSDRLALNLLGLGLSRQSKILAQLPNWAELFVVRLAAEKAGLKLVTVPPTFRSAELGPIVRFTRPEAAIVPGVYRGFDYCELLSGIANPELKHLLVAREEVPRGALAMEDFLTRSPKDRSSQARLKKTRHTALDVCQIATTSGSTGIPKCVEVPLYTRLLTGSIHARRFGVGPDDTLAAVTPIVAGTADALVYNGGCSIGARIVLVDYFDPAETCAVLAAERVSVVPLVPTMITRILALPDLGCFDLKRLRTVVNHGASLPYPQGVEIERRLDCHVVQGFGAVDCGGISATFWDDPPEVRLGTVGQPLEGNEIRIVGPDGTPVSAGEVGRLLVRGLHTDASFFSNPDLNASSRRDGYFDTRELCRLDGQGNLVLMGREQELIIRGGQNIFPADIEAVLMQHPEILEATAVGIPDPDMGERVCAFVVCREGETVELEDLRSYFQEKGLARFKWPEILKVVCALPRVASGQKVDKKILKESLKNIG